MFHFIPYTEKIFSRAGKKNEAENFAHFEKNLFFEKYDTPSFSYFFDRKQTFANAKK
jgi:hypothetical protein